MYSAESPWQGFFAIPVATASVDLVVGGFPGLTFTDLVIDDSVNTTVTSAGHAFVAADVGKLLLVTGGTGFTAGVYYIASVADGAATLSATVGTVASTGGTGQFLTDCRSIYIGGSGDVAATSVMVPTLKATFASMPVGLFPVRPAIVYKAANGTTATNVIGMFS